MFKALIEKIKNTKGLAIILIGLSVGIFLICASSFSFSQDGKENKENTDFEEYNLAQYTDSLEKKLEGIISGVSGAANARVMITLEGTFEQIYVNNASVSESNNADKYERKSERELVLKSTKTAGQSPVLTKQLTPKIKGIVIVCDGGDSATVQQKIISLASTAFNISSNRIFVAGGKK